MAGEYIRVRRGMVFSYNIDENVDKYNVPKITLEDGRVVSDYTQYGVRPYLVISTDENNIAGITCTIVPMTTSKKPNESSAHVKFNYRGTECRILCDQIHTVNVAELINYESFLSDEIMNQVEDALSLHLGLKKYDMKTKMSLDRIEEIITHMMESQIDEIAASKSNEVEISEVADRLYDKLLNKVNGSDNTKKVVRVDETKTPVVRKKKATKKKVSRKRRWSREELESFCKDIENYTPEDMVTKYGLTDKNHYNKMKYYAKNRLGKME